MNEPTILIAEDEEIDVILLKRAFKNAGIDHALKVVRDGQEAIDYLNEIETYPPSPYRLPVLFLLDINMPRCNGLEVLEKLRQKPDLRALPVVVFSSSNLSQDIQQAYRLGANAYLVKPTSIAQRNEVVGTIRAFWLQLNQVPSNGLPE